MLILALQFEKCFKMRRKIPLIDVELIAVSVMRD